MKRWWIDTKDKRPENLDVVLCVNEFGGMWIEQYYNGFSGEQPTHWMPLPDPPAGSYEKLNTSEKGRAMKLEKKIEKILDECGINSNEMLARQIVKAITEEPKPIKFRDGEIVRDRKFSGYTRFNTMVPERHYEKLTVQDLAITTAPPDAVRWVLKDNSIYFFDKYKNLCRTDSQFPYYTYCCHIINAEGWL